MERSKGDLLLLVLLARLLLRSAVACLRLLHDYPHPLQRPVKILGLGACHDRRVVPNHVHLGLGNYLDLGIV
jgi:hypothetical protein